MQNTLFIHICAYTRLQRIIRRTLARRGISTEPDMLLKHGHWHVRRAGLWIRTTDALSMEVVQ